MRLRQPSLVVLVAVAALGACSSSTSKTGEGRVTSSTRASTVTTTSDTVVTGMPPIVDPANNYSEAAAGDLSPKVQGDPARVYVPNGGSNTVSVIDPTTFKVIDTIRAGVQPQHIVPSYDLRTLWELNDRGASVMPIDPATGQQSAAISVRDPYNLYFTPDGAEAIVVAEALRMLDFRDPHTMKLHESLHVADCEGINHSDYSRDGSYAIFTCEFNGRLAKVDIVHKKVLGYLDLGAADMPQDVRVGPDGTTFYVADMIAGGVHVIDGPSFRETSFIETGVGTHGLNPSRDGKLLYISNRGTTAMHGVRHGKGSVSVLRFADKKVIATWPIPGGGSPDMGNVSADGTLLWLSGRYDSEVYVFDLVNGGLLHRIPVGVNPHGLVLWPLPGRVSFGHTGNTR